MSGVYDEIEIEDMDFDEELEIFYYPCPCGDRFQISLDMIKSGEEIGMCPSCSLTIRIIYDTDSHKVYDQKVEEYQKSVQAN